MTTPVHDIINELVEQQLLQPGDHEIRPLTGGVSSSISLVDDGRRRLVIKQALDTLKVEKLWQVDVRRNATEQRFLREVGSFLPGATPRLVHGDEVRNFFVMDYLDGFDDWKTQLLAGRADLATARRAGTLLGKIHGHTWAEPRLLDLFDTTADFHLLRTDPYLLTTASHHPDLDRQIRTEALRLERHRRCLVHGDFSPKNLMVRGEDVVLVDCEVGWYGDPAFDLAFLFTHFLLKALLHQPRPEPFVGLIHDSWSAYQSSFGVIEDDLEQRAGRLLLMLLLARIDGKSPVEYLTEPRQKRLVRKFVYDLLPEETYQLDQIGARWVRRIAPE